MMTCYLNFDGTTSRKDWARMYMTPDWVKEPVIRAALMDIDSVTEIEGLTFKTEEWGYKTPDSISGGVRALMLLAFAGEQIYKETGHLISNASMGPNCSKYLQQLSMKYDFPIAWDVFMKLDLETELLAKDSETGEVFHTADELLDFYQGRCVL